MKDSFNGLTEEFEKICHKKLITNLNKRGWAIYESKVDFMHDESELEEMVSGGSEKESLTLDVRYQVLPYVKEDSNYEKVKKAMYACIASNRYPFWVDLETYIDIDEDGEEKEYVKANGVYLIDTIVYNGPYYELVVDYLLMGNLNIFTKNVGNVVLSLNELDKILKQLTLRERKNV